MQKRTQKKFNKKQEAFIKRFVDIAYENMAIEQEVTMSRQEAYKRYRQEAVDLVKDGTYKKVRL